MNNRIPDLTMARNFPSISNISNRDSEYAAMFKDDILLSLASQMRGENLENSLVIKIDGDEMEMKKANIIIGQLAQSNGYTIKEAICKSVTKIAEYLIFEGMAVYELCTDNEEIYICNFTSKRLIKILRWNIQLAPRADWNFLGKKLRCLNSKKIWSVRIPNQLGGTKEYRKTLDKLGRVNLAAPEFIMRKLSHDSVDFLQRYDHNEYSDNSAIYCYKVTKKWGWFNRDYVSNSRTEFYTMYKYLSFRWAQAVLREHIIQEINNLLQRLSINCKVVVSGLPTPEEILKVRSDTQKGIITFSDAMKATSP